jgi:hypothetical protein
MAAAQVNDNLTIPEVEMKNALLLGLLVTLTAVAAACGPSSSVQVTTPDSTMQLTAPGPNPMLNQPDGLGRVARAGAGLWHGIIAPITLVLSFFNSDIQMYEVHNAGSEYDLGFLIGVTVIVSLLGLFIRMRR